MEEKRKGVLLMDCFYKEYSGRRWHYWTYDDGRRVFLDAAWAQKQIDKGTARVIIVN
jgi:hypothetical protein